jgi:hypothetical protein
MVAVLCFDDQFILDSVGESWAILGADHDVRDAVVTLQEAGISQMVTPADVPVKKAGSITDTFPWAIRGNIEY